MRRPQKPMSRPDRMVETGTIRLQSSPFDGLLPQQLRALSWIPCY